MQMNTLHLLFKRIREMHQATYLLLKWSLILSCVVIAAAAFLLLTAGRFGGDVVYFLHISDELANMPQSILLLAAIASVCMEDLAERRD